MIISTFSTLGFQGKVQVVSSHWFVDSRASNHMISSSDILDNIKHYISTQYIQIANGSTIPITAVGDIGSSFDKVCLFGLIY